MADSLMASLFAAGPFGLGCAPLGNLYRAMTDEAAHHLLEAAWEAGVRWFDTAPHYGLGLSERRLGAFLSDKPRDQFVVSTKVGRRLEPLGTSLGRDDEGFDVAATHRRVWDFSADGIERTLEQSLERLGLDRLDVVLLHDPTDHLEQAVVAVSTLSELRIRGTVRAVGAGTADLDALDVLLREADLDLVMVAGRYTLLDQSAGVDLLPLCLERGVEVLNVGLFNSGILATATPPDGATFDYGPASDALLRRARAIAEVCAQFGTSLPAAAMAFARSHPAIASISIGAASAEELNQDAILARNPPSGEFWAALAGAGLVDPVYTPNTIRGDRR